MSDMAKGRKGQILTLALLVMFVGGVILAGLFQYMGSSLLLATRGEENAVNYYAADSGIEDAVYGLLNSQNYSHKEYILEYKNSTVNNRAVDVRVENNPSGCGDGGENCYLITSTATHNKSGASTTIESYIHMEFYDLAAFGYGAITSNTHVNIQPGCTVDGNVSVPGADEDLVDNKGTLNGDIVPLPGLWPTAEQLRDMFLPMVDELNHFPPGSTIDVKDTPTIWPLYRDGDLQIYSSKKNQDATLNGTVYVTGDLDIGKTKKKFTLDLNGQVIFVEGDIDVGGKTTITGSGFIIAIGDIKFWPKLETSADDYVLVMSIEGWVNLQPNGDFYGSVVGEVEVNLQPGNSIIWSDPNAAGLEFPVIDIFKILTYDIVDR